MENQANPTGSGQGSRSSRDEQRSKVIDEAPTSSESHAPSASRCSSRKVQQLSLQLQRQEQLAEIAREKRQMEFEMKMADLKAKNKMADLVAQERLADSRFMLEEAKLDTIGSDMSESGRVSPAALRSRHDKGDRLKSFLDDCSQYSDSISVDFQPDVTPSEAEKRKEACMQEFREKSKVTLHSHLYKDEEKVLDERILAIKFQMDKLEEEKRLSQEKVKADQKMMEEIALQQPEVKPEVTSPPTPPDHLKQLVEAMTNAFLQARPEPTASTATDKFLARQTHGKDLPHFYGRPEEWITFKLSFENTSAACQYNDVDNLARLQKCLKGEALKLVQNLMGTPSNVPVILKDLELRFGQPRHIINSLTEKVKEVPQVKEDKLETLIELGIAVKTLVSTIKALKIPEHLNNPTLIQLIEGKLPSNYRLQWGQWRKSDSTRIWDMENLTKWLSDLTEIACELCPPPKVKEDWKAREKPPDQYRNNKRRTEHVCAVEEAAENKSQKDAAPKKKWCQQCNVDGHRLQECRVFQNKKPADRIKLAKEKRLCFGCLNFGHSKNICKSKKTCNVDGCQQKHHPLIHNSFGTEPKNKPEVIPKDEEKPLAPCNNNPPEGMHMFEDGQVVYQVLPVNLKGPKGTLKVYAMLDGGGAYSLIENETALSLGLEGEDKPLRFKPVGNEVQEVPSQKVKLEIQNPKTGVTYPLEDVRTFSKLSLPCRSLTQRQLNKWEHLKSLALPTYENIRPKILIGIPDAWLTTPIKLAKSPPNAPTAFETRLGWTVTGTVPKEWKVPTVEGIYHTSPADEDDDYLHRLVQYHFSTEAFGIKPDVRKPRSADDKRAEEVMEINLKKLEDGHYETGLLWKSDDVILPESRTSALKRLLSLERKLDGDPELAVKYCKKIDYYLEAGYLKKLSPEDYKYEGPRKWYLPHFAVTKASKPGKIRFVLDAAAFSHNTSLNANLLTGPDILNPLPAVLCKFRQRRIAITADIKEMFHQVRIKSEDQHAQRILWRGMSRESEPEEFQMTVMIFGAACSPYCAQEVKNTNARQWAEEFPEASQAIIKRHYVDDYLDSCDSEDEAQQIWEDVVEVHKRGGYHICNFLSNSKELIKKISPELRSDSQKDLNIIKEGLWTERVLGMTWDPENDQFTFSTNFYGVKPEILSGENIPTKRQALSLIMSIFDPMGFVAHLTIKAKLILQETWKEKLGWEDKLQSHTYAKWKMWLEELMEIPTCKIPRCYSTYFSFSANVQLHIFCDASSQAYASVAYFRVDTGSDVEVSLVMAKSRVVSSKPTTTIPRCELDAAVMGTRLSKAIVDNHEVKPHRIIFWTDSVTVLRWLKMGDSKLGVYVSNRVGEIQESTDVNSWKYVPTEQNVADEATRDIKPCDWSPDSRWLNGPAFLKNSEENWPSQDFLKTETIAHVADDENEKCPIDISRFSNWMRLLRTSAYVLQIYNKAWRLDKKLLSPDDIKAAERKWWKWTQAETYGAEIKLLKDGKQLQKKNSLTKYSPFIDEDGILRMRSRIQSEMDIGDIERNPVILPPKHPYTKLMINFHHMKAGHHGQEKVVNDLRRKFAIPGLRVAVRRSWNDCQLCKNRRATPAIPEMAPLPNIRMETVARPFTYTGLDYFGPMEVTIGRRHEKRYGALFTCLSTRAVHMEIAASLTTDSCLMAIRRFICRRGKPEAIWSDNGTNFIGANNELQKALLELDQQLINDEMTTRGITWKFIPPSAPHMGGSWERMVKAIKIALAATLDNKYPKEEVLQTLMVEAENSVNGRPLTYVSEETDSPLALTPNHILLLEGNHLQNQGNFDDKDLLLRKQWRQAQRLSDIFWKRWLTEYLPTLARREKWHQQQRPIEVDDVVLILDANAPRNSWQMGRVTKLYPGQKDGKIRVVDLKTATGELRRPVAKLCVLDIKREVPDNTEEEEPPYPQNPNDAADKVAVKTKTNKWVLRPRITPQQQVSDKTSSSGNNKI